MILKRYIEELNNFFYKIFLEKKHKKKLQTALEQKESEDEVYYVISCEKIPLLGLFGYVGIVLAMIRYALDRNMIPIIDWKNYPNTYLETDEIGKVNAWELFFKQISKKNIDEVYAQCKYEVGNHMDIDWNNLPNLRGVKRRDIYVYWSVMFQNYIKFSEKAEEYCEKEYNKL